MSNAMDEVATLAADLRAWVDWQSCLGASAFPRESIADLKPLDVLPVPRAPQPRARPQAPSREPAVPPTVARAVSPPTQSAQPEAVQSVPDKVQTERPVTRDLSDKWKALMDAPTTHRVSGPSGSPLMIIRGSGSSDSAESMLDRMMVNVLGLQRSDVCIVDLNRDTRSPTEIGKGLRRALPGLNPSLVLVMGRFAVEALFGPDVSVEQLRQQWQVLEYEGGRVDLRVTHHPEAILLLGARGQSAPKMEAFHDLKAVSERLTST